MSRKQGVFPSAGRPMGPYTPGVCVGEMVFVSGQGPLDPDTGKIRGESIEEQTELTLANVRRVLEAAGCSMNDCVKATVHLRDMADFDRFNGVYQRFFDPPHPARTTVQSVLWSGIMVEIDVIAVRGASGVVA
jgi:2-iminobutanoate/2-iminopropanoate deaminase